MYKFAAASVDESIVFGSARPGYADEQVRRWIEYMIDWAKPTLCLTAGCRQRERDVQRVCCLLTKQQLDRYDDLLGNYHQAFGKERVCWAPIEDFSLVAPEMLVDRILPFLAIQHFPVICSTLLELGVRSSELGVRSSEFGAEKIVLHN